MVETMLSIIYLKKDRTKSGLVIVIMIVLVFVFILFYLRVCAIVVSSFCPAKF